MVVDLDGDLDAIAGRHAGARDGGLVDAHMEDAAVLHERAPVRRAAHPAAHPSAVREAGRNGDLRGYHHEKPSVRDGLEIGLEAPAGHDGILFPACAAGAHVRYFDLCDTRPSIADQPPRLIPAQGGDVEDVLATLSAETHPVVRGHRDGLRCARGGAHSPAGRFGNPRGRGPASDSPPSHGVRPTNQGRSAWGQ